MKVLMFSTDKDIFEPASAVALRMAAYGQEVDSLSIIVFTKKNYLPLKISSTVTAYATGGGAKFFRFFGGMKIGKDIEADLVTAQDAFLTGLAAYFISRKKDLPLELQVHTDLFSPDYINLSLGNKLRTFVAQILLPKASGVRVVSERVKFSIEKKGINLRREAVVLPIFIDIEQIRKTTPAYDLHDKFPQFSKIILMVARLAAEKDYPLAFRVLLKVLEKEPGAGLVIAGDGVEKVHLARLVQRLGISEKVVWLGWQKDLISLYKTADVFLQTSRYEGYGLVLVEAAVAGLPVVSRPIGIMSSELGFVGEGVEELARGVLVAQPKPFTLPYYENFEAYVKAITAAWRSLVLK